LALPTLKGVFRDCPPPGGSGLCASASSDKSPRWQASSCSSWSYS
jgi:hypothetical protein